MTIFVNADGARDGISAPGAMWNPSHNALALAYRCTVTVAGGYVTARTAPCKPMKHVFTLGLIGLVPGIAGIFGIPGINPGPRCYPTAVVATGFPCIWLGGGLYLRGKR